MEKQLIVEIPSPSRDSLKIYGFRFGKKGKKPSAVIISGFRGDEITHIYASSLIIKFLKENPFLIKGEIFIIPVVNIFGFNVEKRFWPFDNTDISKMFPGFINGETTQRIAAKIFEYIKNYDYGIEIISGEKNAEYVPHVRVLDYEDINFEDAKDFGFRYIYKVKPDFCDNVSILYNWHRLDTKAFSIFGGKTQQLDLSISERIKEGILSFLGEKNIIDYKFSVKEESIIIEEKDLISFETNNSGIFIPFKKAGEKIKKGEILYQVIDPLTGNIKEEIYSLEDGFIFQVFSRNLIPQGETAYLMINY